MPVRFAAQTPADLFRAVRENDLKTLKTADLPIGVLLYNASDTFRASDVAFSVTPAGPNGATGNGGYLSRGCRVAPVRRDQSSLHGA